MWLPDTRIRHRAFTRIELLVVVAMVGVLSVVCIGAMTLDNAQSRVIVCANNIRQMVDASQMYANENQGLLPIMSLGVAWPWDLPVGVAQSFLNMGLQTNNFYCPGTAPRFTDWQNFQEPGAGTNLWNFTPPYHIVGYILAFNGQNSMLNLTNQNTTLQPEMISMGGTYVVTPNAQRVLVADVILSQENTWPGYLRPLNVYTSIPGGFMQNGRTYPFTSSHLNGAIPAGHNLGFKDGHVEWRPFDGTVVSRTIQSPYFWW
jgi:type II secretory pathway pseudopilin PulG